MQYDLVFEGGGAKGSVFIGALREFERRGHTARRSVGTSAGAITATLFAAGYTSEQMLTAATEKVDGKPRFATFMDIPVDFAPEEIEGSLTHRIFERVDIPLLPRALSRRLERLVFDQLMKLDAYRELFSFVELGGLYSGNAFLDWIRERLGPELGSLTLAEFNEKTENDLSLVASDTTGEVLLVLNHRTAPDCPVAWGVRMSMSIPFVWQEVRWQPEWGLYRGRDIADHAIVDGGLLSNFPIDLLTSTDQTVMEIMGETDPGAVPNLGLLIDENLPVDGPQAQAQANGDESLEGGLLAGMAKLRTIGRIKALVSTMSLARDTRAIKEHEREICRLPAKGYGTTEFDMSDERLGALIDAGEVAMRAYFAARE